MRATAAGAGQGLPGWSEAEDGWATGEEDSLLCSGHDCHLSSASTVLSVPGPASDGETHPPINHGY